MYDDEDVREVTCPDCDGTGQQRDLLLHGDPYNDGDYEYYTCSRCNGTGKIKQRKIIRWEDSRY